MHWNSRQGLWQNQRSGGRTSATKKTVEQDSDMMRIGLAAATLAALSACAPSVPNSAAGVGFNTSLDAQRAREAALAGQTSTIAPAPAISDEALALPPAAPLSALPAQPLNAASAAQGNDAILAAAASLDEPSAAAAAPAAPAAAPPSGATSVPLAANNPGLSDENDFQAVSQRESIASDAERIERNSAVYTQIQPTQLPERTGSGPNIVQYALDTQHIPGTRLYSRAGLNLVARAQRACSRYPSADQAQLDFLANGGPERDRIGVDPDGDGFACTWDPRPFRTAVSN